jgi:hypothetical protein
LDAGTGAVGAGVFDAAGAGAEAGLPLQAINKTPIKNNPDFLAMLIMYMLLLFEPIPHVTDGASRITMV